MHTLARTLIACTLVAATGLASAGPRHYGHHHHRHHHHGSRIGLAVGLALAVPLIAMAHHAERPPEVVYVPPPAPLPPPPVVYAPAPSPAVPVIYPRNGQSPSQLESDQRECNRWATSQQAAMADATVFNRAVEACMDGRGYTMR